MYEERRREWELRKQERRKVKEAKRKEKRDERRRRERGVEMMLEDIGMCSWQK
jgi:hypothetical protein